MNLKLSGASLASTSIAAPVVFKPAETNFRLTYKKKELETSDFDEVINRCRTLIKKISNPPSKSSIQYYEEFTRPSFAHFTIENETKPFYDASMAVTEFVGMLTNPYFEPNKQKFVSHIGGKIQEEWQECSRCPQLQQIMKAAFGIIADIRDFIEKSYTPSLLIFIANTLLLQSSISQTQSYQLVLEIYAQAFVFKVIEKHKDRIQGFIENERQIKHDYIFAEEAPEKNNTDFRDFIQLVTVLARMRKDPDFGRHFYSMGTEIISSATDFTQPRFVAAFIKLLASLSVDKETSELVYDRLAKSNSQLINLPHFLQAISGYADDFNQSQANVAKLSEDDSSTLESIFRLLSSLFKHSELCRREIINSNNLINNLITYVSSMIPATLKSCCYDTLSEISQDETYTVEIWKKFVFTEILTPDNVQSGTGGIILDIEKTELAERAYPLMRSFVRFLSKLVQNAPPPLNFEHIHVFLLEFCLLKLPDRLYAHFNEKWSILCEICQVWTNLFKYDKVHYNLVMRSALCDQRFIRGLLTIVVEDETPLETLLCVYRLLFTISQHEEEFFQNPDSSFHSSVVSLSQQVSWSSDFLKKLILSVAENDKDVQISAISLSQYLANNAAQIVQVVFTSVKPIPCFIKVIERDEEEEPSKIGNEETCVRVRLLKFLVSLGSSSYFARYVSGFDVSDPPTSLLKSTLEKGIIPKLVEKMGTTMAAKNYPRFAAASLQLMLMLCDHSLTVSPLLSSLRSSPHSFFDRQLVNLQDNHSSMTAIGCFLMLLAREAMESAKNSSGTTLHVVQILLNVVGFSEQRSRVVLAFEFIDRIDDSDEATLIAKGMFQAVVSFITNKNVIISAKHWGNAWISFMIHLLNKITTVSNSETTMYLSQAVGFIGHSIFADKIFGKIDKHDILVSFNALIEALISLHINRHSDSMLGVYSLFTSLLANREIDEELCQIYLENSSRISSCFLDDMKNQIPVTKAAVFAAAESLVSFAKDSSLDEFISYSIAQLPTDWLIFDEDNDAGAFVLGSKFSFFTRVISSGSDPSIFIQRGLITLIGHKSMWESLGESFSTSTNSPISELILQTASKAIKAMSALAASSSNNEDVKKQSRQFISDFAETFSSVFQFGGFFTLDALQMITDLVCFMSLVPSAVDKYLMNRLASLRQRFIGNEQWRELLRKKAGKADIPSPKTYQIAIGMTKRIIMAVNYMIPQKK
ncbi:hypothetical protein TVAG_398870 [Trichomonas vaginalis G3]|uniref:Uncharacterized protein n=1 Tax=Trichomonas vaginalis (strain ATCC PRA-98 / G3) TaxID=412133 RepID=A2EVH6_TRIV3|nr:nuclear pore organization [Trichomonas vaginalis G3]EAY03362.1 hypothetical protein TVAG_398870 [Trichomonas vaginalis G3]KAI5518837.1 nuclear pore organization [Trichomonas vaginalis G3]|eukprot:XP_001315585.1 hypothetical protein [Trichomonas vaginalis G3]